VIVNKNLR